MNDKRLLINALLLLIFALGIVYSFRYTQKQNQIVQKATYSSSSYEAIGFSSSISAKKVAQVASASENYSSVAIKKLNSTTIIQDVLPIEKVLGIKPRYTLKYLDTYIFNLSDIRNTDSLSAKVKSLWGDMNYMTPNEIEQFWLPWEKLAFLNIPSIKDNYVLLALFDWNDMWLLDIPTSTYQTRKKGLKVLFDQ